MVERLRSGRRGSDHADAGEISALDFALGAEMEKPAAPEARKIP
jgi:hypothetical protein